MSKPQRGFTLVELMVVLAIVGVLVLLALPSFSEGMRRQRLRGAAEAFQGALYAAKAEALRTGQPVHYSVVPGAAGCYGFRVGAPCDCTQVSGASQCTLMATRVAPGQPGIASTSMAAGAGFIEPVRGTVSAAGQVVWRSASGQELRVGLTSIGRVYACSPAGAGRLSGYSAAGC